MMGNYHVRFGERWDRLYNRGSRCKLFLSIAGQMTTGSSVYSTSIHHFEPYTEGFSNNSFAEANLLFFFFSFFFWGRISREKPR
ncbi:hypothetical protein ABFX02_14G057500 [Erythranthe guttata]